MKLLEQTRRTWQGTRLRDKVLPSHCQPAGVIYLRRINTSPTTPNSRDSSQEHSRLLRDPAWGWACPAPRSPHGHADGHRGWPGPLPRVLLVQAARSTLSLLPPLRPALCSSSRRSGMDLEHPPLTEASRHQPGKPVPWGGLRKEPDGGLAAAQTMDWLQVHTQGLGPLLAPQGSPDHLIPACIWEQYNFSPAYWKARKRGLLYETRHPTCTSRATPHINSSRTHKKKLGLAHGHLLPLQSRWVMPLMLLQHL